MDPYNEEMRAKFIALVDDTALILSAALERLTDAKRAALANDPAAAFAYHAVVMDVLRDFVEQSKKEPRSFF